MWRGGNSSTTHATSIVYYIGVVNMNVRKTILRAMACAAIYINLFDNERRRRIWVKKYRQRFGHIPLINELRENYQEDFKNYLRMDCTTFQNLLNLVESKLSKQDTVMRQSISAEERLAATLRFLATGRSFEDLKFSTGISTASLCIAIPETGKIIYETLKQDYMKFPTSTEEWLEIANGVKDKWQFINCGGALDGKHIRIIPPPHSGAQYYNYKIFYSIILMVLVNSNYEFIFVDIGKNGRMSNGGVIEYTEFYRKLKAGHLQLPENCVTEKNYNFIFLGDEAYEHMLKPYSQKELDFEKRIFNYRLSRARNVVENTFGIISSRFRLLHTAAIYGY